MATVAGAMALAGPGSERNPEMIMRCGRVIPWRHALPNALTTDCGIEISVRSAGRLSDADRGTARSPWQVDSLRSSPWLACDLLLQNHALSGSLMEAYKQGPKGEAPCSAGCVAQR